MTNRCGGFTIYFEILKLTYPSSKGTSEIVFRRGENRKVCAESLGDGFRIVADELLDDPLLNQLFASAHKTEMKVNNNNVYDNRMIQTYLFSIIASV